MPEKLSKMGIFDLAVELKVLDDPVQGPGLPAGGPAKSGGIVHHDQGEKSSHCEKRGDESLTQADQGGQRTHRGGVGAGHPAGLEETPEVDPTLDGEGKNDLDGLNEKPGQGGQDECLIGEDVR